LARERMPTNVNLSFRMFAQPTAQRCRQLAGLRQAPRAAFYFILHCGRRVLAPLRHARLS
jgi:hypothetical protein